MTQYLDVDLACEAPFGECNIGSNSQIIKKVLGQRRYRFNYGGLMNLVIDDLEVSSSRYSLFRVSALIHKLHYRQFQCISLLSYNKSSRSARRSSTTIYSDHVIRSAFARSLNIHL